METSPLICLANQWTSFYMIGISVMEELRCFKFTLRTLGKRSEKQVLPSTFNLAKKKLLDSCFIWYVAFRAIASCCCTQT